MLFIPEFFLGAALGAGVLFFVLRYQKSALLKVRHTAQKLLNEARDQAQQERRELLSRAKDEIHHRRTELELELKSRKVELQRLEHKCQQKDEQLTLRDQALNQLRGELKNMERDLAKRLDVLTVDEERVGRMLSQLVTKLEQVGGMSRDEARKALCVTLEEDVKREHQTWIAKATEEAQVVAREKAVSILCGVMQRHSAEQVTIHSASVVQLPNEDMKGRVIGKEGRNIKALEMATGMEFVIGDTPEVITISGFHPIRREIARRALSKLVLDGRINPTRIEEVVAQCEAELNKNIEEMGKEAVLEVGLSSIHNEIVTLLGQLHFRTSFTQNILAHSKEVSIFSRMIAEELGLDGLLAARCGLLHDIGKAVSHEVDGPHAQIGADIARRCGENPIVVGAIASHHEDVPYGSIYGVITQIADAISATRPGARKETLSAYIKRLEQLEEISTSFQGVKRAYAVQAGREVRVIVDETVVNDDGASVLARDIANRIEGEMNFPGQIKVHVIREKRSVEYAR